MWFHYRVLSRNMKNSVSVGEIRIGDVKVEFEIPKSLYKAISEHAENGDKIKLYSYDASSIIDIFRALIPEEKRPPTHRQESYAKSISEALNLTLTEEIIQSSSSCSDFIDQYLGQYKEIEARVRSEKKLKNSNVSQATRVNRWLSAQEMLNNNVPIEQVAENLGVKPLTIEKYCNLLSEWESETRDNEAYSLIIDLVNRQRAGEDIYVT